MCTNAAVCSKKKITTQKILAADFCGIKCLVSADYYYKRQHQCNFVPHEIYQD